MPEPTSTAAAAVTLAAAGASIPVLTFLGVPLGLRADLLIAVTARPGRHEGFQCKPAAGFGGQDVIHPLHADEFVHRHLGCHPAGPSVPETLRSPRARPAGNRNQNVVM